MQGKLVVRVWLEKRAMSLIPPRSVDTTASGAWYLTAECRGRDPLVALASRVPLNALLLTRRLTTFAWCLLHAVWRGRSTGRGPSGQRGEYTYPGKAVCIPGGGDSPPHLSSIPVEAFPSSTSRRLLRTKNGMFLLHARLMGSVAVPGVRHYQVTKGHGGWWM